MIEKVTKKETIEIKRTPNFYVPNREPVAPVDCSNKFKDVFIELPPYAKDEKGVIINNKNETCLRHNGTINIDDEIQSYRDECSLSSILKKVALTRDFTLLQQVEGAYLDVSNAPKSIHDVPGYLDTTSENFSKLSIEEKQVISKLLGLKIDFDEKTNLSPNNVADTGGEGNE